MCRGTVTATRKLLVKVRWSDSTLGRFIACALAYSAEDSAIAFYLPFIAYLHPYELTTFHAQFSEIIYIKSLIEYLQL